MTDNATIEKMIKEAGATGPRVTEESIKAKIADVLYSRFPETGLTICVIWLRNGFSFVGCSRSVSPENHRRDVGDQVAYEDAFRKIWPCEGYLLQELLHQAKAIAAMNAPNGALGLGLPVDDDIQAAIGHKAHD